MSFAKPAIPSPQPEDSKEYEVITNPEQREIIKRRAIEMVEAAKDCEMVIFLDKTARPLSTLFRDLWPVIYPEKPMPALRFVNIGREKRRALEDFAERLPHLETDLLKLFNSKGDLEEIYGTENIAELEKVISSQRSGKRLIVDEIEGSGLTAMLAKKILQMIDPNSHYSSFALLESDKDIKSFTLGEDPPVVPWDNYYSLVSEPLPRSFVTVPGDEYFRETGLQARTELKMLAQEAAKEYASNNRRSATS